jgi:hypothetical protein
LLPQEVNVANRARAKNNLNVFFIWTKVFEAKAKKRKL